MNSFTLKSKLTLHVDLNILLHQILYKTLEFNTLYELILFFNKKLISPKY